MFISTYSFTQQIQNFSFLPNLHYKVYCMQQSSSYSAYMAVSTCIHIYLTQIKERSSAGILSLWSICSSIISSNINQYEVYELFILS